jgi:hypothetical protein
MSGTKKQRPGKPKQELEGVDLNALALSIVNRATGDPAARMPTEPAPASPPGFPYTITIAWSDADFCYVGRVRALDVTTYESTPADAARQAHAAGEAMLERFAERGDAAPPADVVSPEDALGRLGILRSAGAQAPSVAKLSVPKKRRR